MIHRRNNSSSMLTALAAAVAVLLYSFVALGSHDPGLHMASNVIAAGGHGHADGGHSHDDLDVEPGAEASDAPDHHHADHTHEKAGLLGSTGSSLRSLTAVSYSDPSRFLSSGPPYGIERPPRP
ncbi:hypothetical protein HFO60_29295 [Rhizobium leguminosarum]|nr:hypothetical protein [Rhizobium leguminosarum]MBY5551134.1 hypothetical protein [Rhizobium leguminosarum]MBY5565246.1 hypothetical protein [Rhizobium leguminosarum]MBY5608410.1 hypothetical protein [Rhizobium leguminosarum]MBY5645284.1 hypothetical protein [Rhizobium leguminosarum]